MLINDVKRELTEHIAPFWAALEDKENGGFYGYVGYDLKLDKKADKGVILHSRILWFFSNCYRLLGEQEYLRLATHAYNFIKDHCVDRQFGGVYWLTDYKGQPADDMKHTYNIAFAIYALSAYYRASGNPEALALAEELFEQVEEKTPDEYGYGEAFTRNWEPAVNEALSENGLTVEKTMNTVLHLIEAYTELYLAGENGKVADRLKFLLSQMSDIIYDPERTALRVFFDSKFNVMGDIHSYGHDIEATWLVDRACDALDDKELTEKFRKIDLAIAENILSIAFENGALNNERDGDKIDKKRVWWVQAEAVVGFINAYGHSGEEKFLKAANSIWEYIMANVSDKRPGGEWYSEVSFEGKPHDWKEEAGPWKCPYHNGRMCMEIIKRSIH